MIIHEKDGNMEIKAEEIFNTALKLKPVERAGLVDRLLLSLDIPDKTIDEIWQKEIDKRLKAYEAGEMGTVSVQEVLSKYKTK